MMTIEVALGARSYPVHIGTGVLARAAHVLAPLATRGPLAIVTDTGAEPHAVALADRLAAAGIPSRLLTVPAGERSKSWAELERVCDWLLDLGVGRQDHVVAVGGGVVGDLAGFATSIVKRGCRVVQVPTTLLAQVDSSVGGKTAINSRAGKNLIGTFHQPALVLVDPETLDTLPSRDLAAGYAEIVKYGLIDDPDFFQWCEANGAALIAGDVDLRLHAIAHSIAAKARIVAADEREMSGRRALLNLGHTFGHALEAEAGFSDRLLHGEAVAAGCALAFRFSAERGLCAPAEAERVAAHFRSIGLPDGLAASGIVASGETLTAHMRHDKKMEGGTLPFILARAIGDAFVNRSVAIGDVAAFLDRERR